MVAHNKQTPGPRRWPLFLGALLALGGAAIWYAWPNPTATQRAAQVAADTAAARARAEVADTLAGNCEQARQELGAKLDLALAQVEALRVLNAQQRVTLAEIAGNRQEQRAAAREAAWRAGASERLAVLRSQERDLAARLAQLSRRERRSEAGQEAADALADVRQQIVLLSDSLTRIR